MSRLEVNELIGAAAPSVPRVAVRLCQGECVDVAATGTAVLDDEVVQALVGVVEEREQVLLSALGR